MNVFFSFSGGYDTTHEARHGICRNYWESDTHVSGRIMRRVTEERLDVSFTGIYSRLVPRTRLYAFSLVSPIPLARFAGITYSIPIYDIPEPYELYGGIRIIKG